MATTTETPRKKLSYKQLRALFADLNPNRVSTRKQGGRELSYLEAWDVKAALIRVFGPAGFSYVVEDGEIVQIEKVVKYTGYGENKKALPFPENFNWMITAKVRGTLTIHQTGAQYGGVALSSQTGPDFGEVSDFAMKTADSDAFKRSAIYLGTQFGLSLYDSGSTTDVVRMSMADDAPWPQPKPEEPAPGKQETGEPVNAEGQALVERALQMAKERDDARAAEQVNEDTPPAEPEMEPKNA